jgi:hypothetical protein
VFDRWYERNRHAWRLELNGLDRYLDDPLELRRIRFRLAMEPKRREAAPPGSAPAPVAAPDRTTERNR